jgi:hypothetical protein
MNGWWRILHRHQRLAQTCEEALQAFRIARSQLGKHLFRLATLSWAVLLLSRYDCSMVPVDCMPLINQCRCYFPLPDNVSLSSVRTRTYSPVPTITPLAVSSRTGQTMLNTGTGDCAINTNSFFEPVTGGCGQKCDGASCSSLGTFPEVCASSDDICIGTSGSGIPGVGAGTCTDRTIDEGQVKFSIMLRASGSGYDLSDVCTGTGNVAATHLGVRQLFFLGPMVLVYPPPTPPPSSSFCTPPFVRTHNGLYCCSPIYRSQFSFHPFCWEFTGVNCRQCLPHLQRRVNDGCHNQYNRYSRHADRRRKRHLRVNV